MKLSENLIIEFFIDCDGIILDYFKMWENVMNYDGHLFTFGNSPAAINLCQELERTSKYRKRKITRLLDRFYCMTNGLIKSNMSRENKEYFLQLLYEDNRKNIKASNAKQYLTDLTLNVLSTIHKEKLRRMKETK